MDFSGGISQGSLCFHYMLIWTSSWSLKGAVVIQMTSWCDVCSTCICLISPTRDLLLVGQQEQITCMLRASMWQSSFQALSVCPAWPLLLRKSAGQMARKRL
jgi:hypothetical protein